MTDILIQKEAGLWMQQQIDIHIHQILVPQRAARVTSIHLVRIVLTLKAEWRTEMKPHICFLTHSDHMHPRQLSLLSEVFRVTTVGADWSYGQLTAPWRLRGHDCIMCQTVYHAMMVQVWAPKTPYVVENHGDLLGRNILLARCAIKKAAGLRATSQFTRNQFRRYTQRDVAVFPPWINRTLFERVRPSGHWSEIYGRPLILYLGGPHRHKGSEVVDEANKYLKHRITSLFGLDARIVAEVISDADCVVVPSLYEGYGIVPIEAMLAGAPVVASRVGGLAELHSEETVRFVEPGDALGLGGAVEQTLTKTAETRAQVMRAQEWARGIAWEENHVRGFSDLYSNTVVRKT